MKMIEIKMIEMMITTFNIYMLMMIIMIIMITIIIIIVSLMRRTRIIPRTIVINLSYFIVLNLHT